MRLLFRVYLLNAVLIALAVGGSVTATPIGSERHASLSSVANITARDGENNNVCTSTEGSIDEGSLSDSTACDPSEQEQTFPMEDDRVPSAHESPSDLVTVTVSSVETSTLVRVSTTTALATTTVLPSAPSMLVSLPEEYALDDDRVLWHGSPTLNDFADVPVANRTQSDNPWWQEMAAVANVLIHHQPRWLPAVVFGAPHDFYSSQYLYSYGKSARARSNLNGDLRVLLNLFPASKESSVVDVSISKSEVASNPYIRLWIIAIVKAFEDVQVQERLEREDDLYNFEMLPTVGARKTMAILHMLTGYEIEMKSKKDYSTASEVITDFSSSSATPGTEVSQGIDVNPTVFYDQDGGMRPIIHNPIAAEHSNFPFRLLDCRAGGMVDTTYGGFSRPDTPVRANEKDKEAYDRLWTEAETFNNMDWIVRLANKQWLDIDSAFEKLEHARATFDAYYYEDRIWREEYSA